MKMQKVLKYAVVIRSPYSLISTFLKKEDADQQAKLFAGGAMVVPFKGMNCDSSYDPFFKKQNLKKKMSEEDLALFAAVLMEPALRHR